MVREETAKLFFGNLKALPQASRFPFERGAAGNGRLSHEDLRDLPPRELVWIQSKTEQTGINQVFTMVNF